MAFRELESIVDDYINLDRLSKRGYLDAVPSPARVDRKRSTAAKEQTRTRKAIRANKYGNPNAR